MLRKSQILTKHVFFVTSKKMIDFVNEFAGDSSCYNFQVKSATTQDSDIFPIVQFCFPPFMIFFFYFRPLSFSTLNIHRPWSLVTTRWKEIICTAVKKKETKSGKKWKFLSMCVKFCVCEYNPHRLWPIERQRLVFFYVCPAKTWYSYQEITH